MITLVVGCYKDDHAPNQTKPPPSPGQSVGNGPAPKPEVPIEGVIALVKFKKEDGDFGDLFVQRRWPEIIRKDQTIETLYFENKYTVPLTFRIAVVSTAEAMMIVQKKVGGEIWKDTHPETLLIRIQLDVDEPPYYRHNYYANDVFEITVKPKYHTFLHFQLGFTWSGNCRLPDRDVYRLAAVEIKANVTTKISIKHPQTGMFMSMTEEIFERTWGGLEAGGTAKDYFWDYGEPGSFDCRESLIEEMIYPF